VDRLEVLGLIDHDKAPPGRLGWQSAMRARSELIGMLDDVIRSGEMRLARLREPLLLRVVSRIWWKFSNGVLRAWRFRPDQAAWSRAKGSMG